MTDCYPVAFSEALGLLYWAMCAVLHCCIMMAIKMASIVGVLFNCRVVDCRPGSCRGYSEQVVARWRLLGASSVALDLLHQAMPRALLQHDQIAIKMACNRDTTICHC